MKTILRLGFAMGGGVSLGSFCGAALTEVIKLSLLEIAAAWREGKKPAFDDVEVDVFSGASAGCLSLALMLRSLAHQTVDEKTEARAALAADPQQGPLFQWLVETSQQPGESGTRASRLVEQLIAAQSAQRLQHEAWVTRIDIKDLLPSGPQSPELTTQPGLLDFDIVREIARDLLIGSPAVDPAPPEQRFANPQVLGRRVLFAATLSNVSPIVHDARREFSVEAAGMTGLTDGLRSNVHRELRVFDVNFRDLSADAGTLDKRFNETHPYRWVVLHRGAKPSQLPDGDLHDLRDAETWSMIGTTAMASGAVPFAFPPVVLKRWDYEFGYDRESPPDEQKGCTWPSPLRDNHHPSHPFTYVDGGTFNNEPIREAFRLASFIDSQSSAAGTEVAVHRRIVFVDPFISDENPSLAIGLHQTIASGDKRTGEANAGSHPEKRAPFTCATLDRLVPQVGQILGAVLDEARVVESDKVFQTRHRFELRSHIHKTIALVRLAPIDAGARKDLEAAALDIIRKCRKQLESDFLASMIPAGNLRLADELARVLRSHPDEFKDLKPEDAQRFCDEPASVGKDFGRWLKALLFAYVDVLMDLGGKSDRAGLISISPCRRPHLKDGKWVASRLELGGEGLGGFAGFMHEETRHGDFGAGRYCAGLFIAREPFPRLPEQPDAEERPTQLLAAQTYALPEQAVQIQAVPGDVFKGGLERLSRRVLRAVKDSRLIQVFPGLDQILEMAIGSFLAKMIKRLQADVPSKRAFELWLNVEALPQPLQLELDGKGMLNDYPAQKDNQRPGIWLKTTADCYFASPLADLPRQSWEGFHLDQPTAFSDPCLPIYRDSLLSLADRKVCDLILPHGDVLQHALATGAVGFTCRLVPKPQNSGPIDPGWSPFYPTPDELKLSASH